MDAGGTISTLAKSNIAGRAITAKTQHMGRTRLFWTLEKSIRGLPLVRLKVGVKVHDMIAYRNVDIRVSGRPEVSRFARREGTCIPESSSSSGSPCGLAHSSALVHQQTIGPYIPRLVPQVSPDVVPTHQMFADNSII